MGTQEGNRHPASPPQQTAFPDELTVASPLRPASCKENEGGGSNGLFLNGSPVWWHDSASGYVNE